MLSHFESGGIQAKRKVVHALKDQFPVSSLCALLNVSRSGYYDGLKRQEKRINVQLKQMIMEIYLKRKRTYGYRRIQAELQRNGMQVNHKRVLRLMQSMNLKAVIRRKRRTKPQGDGSEPRVAENLLRRDFTAERPNQKWVTDITQVAVDQTWIYVSAIKDLCTKEVVACHMALCNDTEFVLETFKQAFDQQKQDVTGLIVHSDQGCQYTSCAYHDMLPKVGAQISMSRRGNCLDNAAMESFFSHLKVEASTLMISAPSMRYNNGLRSISVFTMKNGFN